MKEKTFVVAVPRIKYTTEYLSVKAKTKKSALKQAKEYNHIDWDSEDDDDVMLWNEAEVTENE